jgi:hypothetical protein
VEWAVVVQQMGRECNAAKKNSAGSEKPLPTLMKEKEPLRYWVL